MKLFLLTAFIAIPFLCAAQAPPDTFALENIIVEKYYVAGPADAPQGGSLPVGAVTYRVFVDMKPGYELQMVTGQTNHPIVLQTDGLFYNSSFGATIGNSIVPFLLNFETAALDSYVTFGTAATGYLGTPKSLDSDGSILTGAGGFLQNADPTAGESLLVKDGLILGNAPAPGLLGIDADLNNAFGLNTISNEVITDNGIWFNLDGIQGTTEDNIVMIGQFTTTVCDFSFKLNLQILIPIELQTDQRNAIVFVADYHPSDQVFNDSGDTFVFLQKDMLSFDADCTPISTSNQTLSPDLISVFPNPGSGVYTAFSTLPLTDFTINVLDLQGRLIESENHRNANLEVGIQIDLSAHPDGMYLVQIQTSNGHTASRKIVKTR